MRSSLERRQRGVRGRHVVGYVDDRVAARPETRKLDETWDRHRRVEDVDPEIRGHRLLSFKTTHTTPIFWIALSACSYLRAGPGMSFDTKGVGTVEITASNASIDSPDRDAFHSAAFDQTTSVTGAPRRTLPPLFSIAPTRARDKRLRSPVDISQLLLEQRFSRGARRA